MTRSKTHYARNMATLVGNNKEGYDNRPGQPFFDADLSNLVIDFTFDFPQDPNSVAIQRACYRVSNASTVCGPEKLTGGTSLLHR